MGLADVWGREVRCGGIYCVFPVALCCFPCVLVVSTLSSGYVRAPLPYQFVNAGLSDYKKKEKKKKSTFTGNEC